MASPPLSKMTGRQEGSFADILLREALKGGTTRAEVIQRAIDKYRAEYEPGYEPEIEALRGRANRVLREQLDAGWKAKASSSWKLARK